MAINLRDDKISYLAYLGLHLLVFVALLLLALAAAKGYGPVVVGDSGLKGHRFWFIGATTITLVFPLLIAAFSIIRNSAFAFFALFVLVTLILQIFAEIFFIKAFFKNMVNPVAISFIILRCWILFKGLRYFPGVLERVFLGANLLFWTLNVSQQIIWSSPKILL